jgi:hypothetical protein
MEPRADEKGGPSQLLRRLLGRARTRDPTRHVDGPIERLRLRKVLLREGNEESEGNVSKLVEPGEKYLPALEERPRRGSSPSFQGEDDYSRAVPWLWGLPVAEGRKEKEGVSVEDAGEPERTEESEAPFVSAADPTDAS